MKTLKSMIALFTTLMFMCTVFASCGIPTKEAETLTGDTSGTSVTVTTTEQPTTTEAPSTTVKLTTTTKQQTTATTEPQTTTTKKPTTVPTAMTTATPTTVPTTVMTDAPTTTTVKKTTTTTVKPTTTTTKKATTTTVKPATTTTVKKTTTTTVKPTTTTTKKATTTTVKPTTTKKPTTTTTTTTTTLTTTTTTAPNTNTNSPCAEALRVFELINEERVKAGVAPLEYCYELQPGVDLRAKEIGEYFSHTRPNGTSCFTVADDLGLSVFVCGENIAQGHTTPEWVMSDWMNSQGHRENILRSWFTGVAVGYDPSTNSWVQMFTA